MLIDSTIVFTVKGVPTEPDNPWMTPAPMNCNGCGSQVPNADKQSHLGSCWFTSDNQPDIYLLHAKSADWAGKLPINIQLEYISISTNIRRTHNRVISCD